MNRKLFRGALLQTILLGYINDSPHGVHGYAISTAMQKRFGIRLGASTLYPELQQLEQNGLIHSTLEVVAGKARRKYNITHHGRKLLWENSTQLRLVIPVLATCCTP